MKKKFIFVLVLLIIIPVFVHAYATYDSIVGCGIDTIPKFIKAVLRIVIKVGIPVASIFLIWTGYLFLKAQGDPGKLKTAKTAFIWACIGFGVLLAAWLLAIAFETVITSFSGGTPQDATINANCGDTASGNTGGNINNGFVVPSSVAALCDVKQALGAPAQGLLSDPMTSYNLSSTDPNILQKSLGVLAYNATSYTTEQSYVFVNFGGGSQDGTLLHTQTGNAIGVEVPSPSTINTYVLDPLLSQPSSVSVLHTHPVATTNGVAMDVPPSLNDIIMASAYTNSLIYPPVSIVPANWYVADGKGIWQYSVPPGSTLTNAFSNIANKGDSVMAIPEVKALGLNMDICNMKQVIDSLNSVNVSPSSKATIDSFISSLNVLNPFIQQDEAFISAQQSGNTAGMQQAMSERLDTLQSVGVQVSRVSYISPYST